MNTRRERLKAQRAWLRHLLDVGAVLAIARERTFQSTMGPVLIPMHVYLARTLDEADGLERSSPEEKAAEGWREWADAIAAEIEALWEWAQQGP